MFIITMETPKMACNENNGQVQLNNIKKLYKYIKR